MLHIHNIDSSNSNIAFDSSNEISDHHSTSGTRGTIASAVLIMRARASWFTPAT